jgi:transposase
MDKITRNHAARTLSLGLDVDSETSMVVALDLGSGSIEFEGRIKHDPVHWNKFLARFSGCRVWACYEAGPIGFGLCRMLRTLGIECEIIAPSAVPKSAAGKQQKNDRRDALALAQLFVNRPRRFVRIPTEQEEADRQLIRTRYQLLKDKVRVMARIKAQLLNYGIVPPSGMSPWSKRYRCWLRTFELPYRPLRCSFDLLLNELDGIEQQLKSVTEAIDELSTTPVYHDRVQRLLQIHGVGVLTAMAFLLEVFRPGEFVTAEQLACHLGLTPCELSSAQVYRRGHITHWGSPLLRKLLVEAAWMWVLHDPLARKRYLSIRSGKERKRAIVAMARRLAIAMWAMTVKEQDYAYRWAA